MDELQKKREERTALELFPRSGEIYTLALAKDKKFGLSLFTGFVAFLVATLSVRFFVASSDGMHGRARTVVAPVSPSLTTRINCVLVGRLGEPPAFGVATLQPSARFSERRALAR